MYIQHKIIIGTVLRIISLDVHGLCVENERSRWISIQKFGWNKTLKEYIRREYYKPKFFLIHLIMLDEDTN